MKRLLLSSLLGCMLMGQMNAADIRNQIVNGAINAFSEVTTKAGTSDLLKGAGIALVPLAFRGVAAMGICAPVESHYDISKSVLSPLCYLIPATNITRRALADGLDYDRCVRLKNSVHPIPTAEASTIKLNAFTAFISALMCSASIAKLCGILPESVSKFMGSQITTAGIATGSALSFALLLPSLKKCGVPVC
jgi:hypothetical protein